LPRAPHSVLDAIPLIGFSLVDAIRAGRVEVKLGAIERFTPSGVRFTNGTSGEYDVVLLATGFQAALDALGTLVKRDARGFALRTDRVTSADQPGLYFVGQNYDHTGGLTNIRHDAPLVATLLQPSR
jgi:cation diffusion facilitator CzcD-associated flavoprotein CzcO